MAKRQLTFKTLQADSGQESGMYLFRNGLLMFVPLSDNAVMQFVWIGLKKNGPNKMQKSFEDIAAAHAPSNVLPELDELRGAPSQGEGTHAADPDKS